jgi:hypothetical protein
MCFPIRIPRKDWERDSSSRASRKPESCHWFYHDAILSRLSRLHRSIGRECIRQLEYASNSRHPNVTIAVFIEVFAFFFLRLHRSALIDIKYYQMELVALALKPPIKT